jgi:RHS repeat-associated protein
MAQKYPFPHNEKNVTFAPTKHICMNQHFTHSTPPLLRSPAESYTFSAKERDSETGLSYFGSRYYSSDLSVWLSVDPMSAKYPSLSPYTYCANNPVKVVDPNGEDIGDFYDHWGVKLGTDGKQDGKIYIVHNVGISNKQRKKTIDFIKNNSGNSEVFTDNCDAYKYSSEIVNDSRARLRMCEIAEQDDGGRGMDPSRNREYGGKIENGAVVELPAGRVGDPTVDGGFLEYRGDALFHTHASGTNESFKEAQLTSDSRLSEWIQPPSKQDMNNAGNTTHYVFARRTGHVYLYDMSGTHVKMRHDTFKYLK